MTPENSFLSLVSPVVSARRHIMDHFLDDFLNIKEGGVIDIGCGAGHVIERVTNDNRLLVGLDINRYLVKNAKERLETSRYDFALGDASRLPFKYSVFDYALMTEVLEHLNSPTKALRECARILRPGGKLFVTTPNGLYLKILHHRSRAQNAT